MTNRRLLEITATPNGFRVSTYFALSTGWTRMQTINLIEFPLETLLRIDADTANAWTVKVR